MCRPPERLREFLGAEEGPTAVEYAVMLALILLACITAVTAFGSGLQGSMSTSYNKINTATTQAGAS
jgi:pilus assembly protein Flp/PilA